MAVLQQFAIQTGLDEGSNPKSVAPGTLKQGHNIRFDKAGRVAKCFGTERLGSELQIGVRRLFTRGDELCAVALPISEDSYVYSYSTARADWLRADKVHDVGLSWTTILDDQAGTRSNDFAVSSNGQLLFHAWVTGNPGREDTTGLTGLIWLQVLDTSDGSVFKVPTRVASGLSVASMVRVLALGGYIFVLYSSDAGAAGAIAYESFNETTGVAAGSGTLVSDQNEGSPVAYTPFDAVVDSGLARLILLYEDTSNNLQAVLYSQTTGTLSAAIDTQVMNAAADDDIKCMSVVTSTTGGTVNMFVAFSPANGANATDVRASHCTVTTTAFAANVYTSTEVEAGAGLGDVEQIGLVRQGSGNAAIAWTRGWDSDFTADQGNPYTKTCGITTGGTFPNTQTTAGVQLLSKPFVKLLDNDVTLRHFAFVGDYPDRSVTESTLLSSYLIEFYPTSDRSLHRYLGKVDNDISGIPVTGSIPNVVGYTISTITAGVFRFLACPLVFQGVAAQRRDTFRCGVRWVVARFYPGQPPDMWRSVETQRETVYAAGLLASWDGRTAFDYGMRAPRVRSLFANTSGNMGNGNYVYQAVAAYYSYAGVKHRGPPSVARTGGTLAPDREIFVYLRAHQLDCKQDVETGFSSSGSKQSRFDIYRSVANATTPQLRTYDPQFTEGVLDAGVPQGLYTIFNDAAPDADITDGVAIAMPLAERPVLYTIGGELEDTQPPAPWTICGHGTRLFLISGSRREVYWSKSIDDNPGIAPGFHPTQRMLFDDDLTALASMDDKLVVFSETRIWVVFGEGPNVNGEDNRFSVPKEVQTDVGCVNPRSVVSMPDGVVFESLRGLYLLTRGLELIWIGQPVKDTLASFPFITSAVLVAKHNEIRFTCNDAEGFFANNGRVLVYDYVRKQWLTRSYAVGGSNTVAITDSIVWNGSWVFATPSGTMMRETTGYLANGTAYVGSNVRFAPINGNGPMTWYRMKDLGVAGESVSNHRLSMAVYRDYATTSEQTKTFEAGSDVTTIGPFERALIDVKNQKGQAYELEIYDQAPSNTTLYPVGTGAGFILEGVMLHVQPKDGPPRLSANRRG